MVETLQTTAAQTRRMRRIKRVHFDSIGGYGMCDIAEVIRDLGYEV